MLNRYSIVFISYLLLVIAGIGCQSKVDDQTLPIQVFITLPKDYKIQNFRLNTAPINYIMGPLFERNKPKIRGSVASWSLQSDRPILVNAATMLGPEYLFALLEPGDSIVIDRSNNRYEFSGRGFEKFQLLSDLNEMQRRYQEPKNDDYTTVRSLEDYLEWDQYSDDIAAATDSIISIYQNKIAYDPFNILKEYIYSQIEYKRLTKFGVLVYHHDTLQVRTYELDSIFDSFIGNKNLQWLRSYTGNPSNYILYYDLVRRQVQRKYHFELKNDTLMSPARKLEYADLIERQYKGYVEQTCFTFLVSEQGLKEHLFKEDNGKFIVDTLLRRFYAKPGYKSYKNYMMRYEAKIQKWIVDKKKRELG